MSRYHANFVQISQSLNAALPQVALRHWNSHALVNVAMLLGQGAPHRSLCSSAIIAVGLPAVVSPHAGVPCRLCPHVNCCSH